MGADRVGHRGKTLLTAWPTGAYLVTVWATRSLWGWRSGVGCRRLGSRHGAPAGSGGGADGARVGQERGGATDSLVIRVGVRTRRSPRRWPLLIWARSRSMLAAATASK